ncbi:hypothetical protein [Rhodococcus koreensis]
MKGGFDVLVEVQAANARSAEAVFDDLYAPRPREGIPVELWRLLADSDGRLPGSDVVVPEAY